MLHTFAIYVDNRPGVLNRIASLIRRRAFNIESLTVGHTHEPGMSRMTIVVDTEPDPEKEGKRRIVFRATQCAPETPPVELAGSGTSGTADAV